VCFWMISDSLLCSTLNFRADFYVVLATRGQRLNHLSKCGDFKQFVKGQLNIKNKVVRFKLEMYCTSLKLSTGVQL
jgi:hypothetical protein